jgi:hypothetical protein
MRSAILSLQGDLPIGWYFQERNSGRSKGVRAFLVVFLSFTSRTDKKSNIPIITRAGSAMISEPLQSKRSKTRESSQWSSNLTVSGLCFWQLHKSPGLFIDRSLFRLPS